MRNFIFILLASFALFSNAQSEWQEHWCKGVEYCEAKDYVLAEKEFSLSIVDLERTGDLRHPYVLVDRARLFMLQDRYNEALSDLDKAIDNSNLTTSDRIKALISRMMTNCNLGLDESKLCVILTHTKR